MIHFKSLNLCFVIAFEVDIILTSTNIVLFTNVFVVFVAFPNIYYIDIQDLDIILFEFKLLSIRIAVTESFCVKMMCLTDYQVSSGTFSCVYIYMCE